MSLSKKGQIINALDIGTSRIRLIVAKQSPENKLQIFGLGQASANGLRRGVVVDIEETVKAINLAKEMAERSSGLPVERAYVSLDGSHISGRASRGVVAVSRADGEVSEEDVERAINASQAISLPLNREILQVLPRTFSIDGQHKIKYPVGMNGVRLEADVLIVEASTPIIKNLSKCVNQAGIDIIELVPTPLAASYAILTKAQKELGVALIDLGAGTTGLIVFEEGDILHLALLPVGGGHITNDIAIGLRTSLEVAEKVKLSYGKKDKIDLAKISGEEEGVVSKEKIDNIIEARLLEIFSMLNKELRKIGRQKLLPAGVVLIGGGAKMPNIVEMAKEYLALPAQVGYPIDLPAAPHEAKDPGLATALGLLFYGLEQGLEKKRINRAFFSPAANKLKKWLRTFLP